MECVCRLGSLPSSLMCPSCSTRARPGRTPHPHASPGSSSHHLSHNSSASSSSHPSASSSTSTGTPRCEAALCCCWLEAAAHRGCPRSEGGREGGRRVLTASYLTWTGLLLFAATGQAGKRTDLPSTTSARRSHMCLCYYTVPTIAVLLYHINHSWCLGDSPPLIECACASDPLLAL